MPVLVMYVGPVGSAEASNPESVTSPRVGKTMTARVVKKR